MKLQGTLTQLKKYSFNETNKALGKMKRNIVEPNINKAKQATLHHQYKKLLINLTRKLQTKDLDTLSN